MTNPHDFGSPLFGVSVLHFLNDPVLHLLVYPVLHLLAISLCNSLYERGRSTVGNAVHYSEALTNSL